MNKFNEVEDKKIVEGNQSIAIRLALPAPGKPAGLAVLLHGFSSSMKNSTNEALLPSLLAKNIAVLRFDFRGHGESDGEIGNITITSAVLDLKKAVDWSATEYPELSSIRHVLVGSSFGGAIALAGARQVGASGIILKSPVSDIYQMQLQRRGEDGMREWKDTGVASVTGKKGTSWLKYTYIEDAIQYNLHKIAQESGIPINVIHGNEDEVVPYSHTVQLCNNVGSLAKLMTIDGGDHRYSRKDDFDKMITFLTQQTQLQLGLSELKY